jgi:hypothetical protein
MPLAARGAVPADIDGDGDQDLLVVLDGEAPLLLRNDLPAAGTHWVKVTLTGNRSNREGLGARVELHAGGARQVRYMRRNRGYLSASEAILVFGLGERDHFEWLSITWPDGGPEQVCNELTADATWRIVEGSPCPEQPEP